VIQENQLFDGEDTLFIEEGVDVVFLEHCWLRFQESSVLIAQGGATQDSRITFRGGWEGANVWDGIWIDAVSTVELQFGHITGCTL